MMILDSGLLFLAPLYTERKYFDNDLQKGTHSISCCQIFNTLSKLANVYSTHTETLLQKKIDLHKLGANNTHLTRTVHPMLIIRQQ